MLGLHFDWPVYISNHKWIIQGIIYLIPIVMLFIPSLSICFTCDCKNRSTIIKYIVEKARKANGKIVLVNCQSMTSNEIAELRSIGKDNVEIR